jgi:hypothetical protein
VIRVTAFLLTLVVLLLRGGPPLVKKFLRGYFRGLDVYVVLTFDGKTLAYENPRGVFGHEDKPLDVVPYEIFYSDRYETYYNICWFDCGALYRCQHRFHRASENALYCGRTKIEGSVIGKVLEER